MMMYFVKLLEGIRVEALDMPEVEIRCPEGPQRLFMKMRLSDNADERPHIIQGLNLMELACSDCARAYRKRDPEIFRILHRYAIDGDLVESIVQYKDGSEVINSIWDVTADYK
jgi:hypothetical protein